MHKAHKNFGADLEIKIDTLSKAYGALYVLEGSRMGGLFLSQLIRAQLGEEIPCLTLKGLKNKHSLMSVILKQF